MFSPSSPIVRFGPWLVILTIALAAVGAAFASPDAGSGEDRYGGDFPSFYGAGNIVLDGDGAELYDVERQIVAQADSFTDGDLLYFAYPPFTAAGYAAIVWLPYGAAYVVHTLLAISALIAAIAALRPFVRGAFDGWARLGVTSVAAIASYPVLRSVLGGQNATFTLLGIAAVARFDHDDRPVAAGVTAGLMLYKPQFGLLLIAVLILSRRWTAVVSAGVTSIVLFGVGAFVVGADWVSVWLDALSSFSDLNIAVNGTLMISAWGWVQNLAGVSAWTYVAAGAVVLAVGLPMAFGIATDRWSEIPWYALTPLVIVAAPSALYYDAALVLLPVAVMVAWVPERAPAIIVGVIAVSWSQVLALELGWSPLFPIILAMAALFALSVVGGDRIRVTANRYTR